MAIPIEPTIPQNPDLTDYESGFRDGYMRGEDLLSKTLRDEEQRCVRLCQIISAHRVPANVNGDYIAGFQAAADMIARAIGSREVV